jgi:hypothetical protein
MGVRDRDDVAIAFEVFPLDWEFSHHITTLLLIQIPSIQTPNDPKHTALGLMQASMDG